jgi:hypothetical protein
MVVVKHNQGYFIKNTQKIKEVFFMKKLISTIVVASMVMGAGSAFAWTWSKATASWSENQQVQTQNLTGVNGGANGMISVTTQDQKGDGLSNSLRGSSAMEGQAQGEITKITFGNGYATHSYNQNVITYGNTDVDGGRSVAGHFESQSLDSGIATVGDGAGTFSISGMATVGSANSNAGGGTFAGGNGEANSGTIAQYENGYTYKNIGATSGIVQSGYQSGLYETSNNSEYEGAIAGADASSRVNAQQVGGTVALNNGNGTYMAGVGAAKGSVKVSASANININTWTGGGDTDAAASAEQVQQHSYTQTAFNPTTGQSQWAAGTVGTYNNVGVHVSD